MEINILYKYTSARDVGWRGLFSLPLNPPRTHSGLYHHMCLRTDGHERKDTDATLRTIFVSFGAKGVLYAWGPVQPANGPLTRTTSG